MKLMRNVRLAALGIMLGALGLRGCNCNSGIVFVDEVHIELTYPTNGATVTSPDDVVPGQGPGQAGIQINVQVTATGLRDGALVALTDDRNVNGSGVPIPTQGTVSGEQVTFAGYSMAEGLVTLRVARESVLATEACDGTNCDEVTVNVVESICLFNTPRDGDILTTDANIDPADPFDPFEADFTLDCRGVDTTENVALVVGDGGIPVVGQPDADGRVTFAKVELAEGANKVTASARTDAGGANAAGGVSTATVTVSTGRCLVNVSPADGSRLLHVDDRSPSVPGMQAVVDVATDCAATSTVSLYVKGPNPTDTLQLVYPPGPAAGVAVHPLGFRFRIDPVDLPESMTPGAHDVQLVATVEEAGGRKGSSLRTNYWVDSIVPTFVQAQPSTNACLDPSRDTDATRPGIQIIAAGTVSSVGDGSEVWARISSPAVGTACTEDADCGDATIATDPKCRADLCRYVGTTAGNAYTIPGIDLPIGSVELEYIATDLAGNVSLPLTATVIAFDAPPVVTILAPTNGASLTVADDVSTTDPGLQFNVQVDLESIPAGSIGNILISGQSPLPFPPPVGDSVYTRIVDLLDGPRQIEAKVQHPICGSAIEDNDIVDITVAAVPVTMAVSAYESGTGLAVAVANGATTIASMVDLDVITGTAVRDRTVNVTITDATDGAMPPSCTGNPVGTTVPPATILAADTGTVIADLAINSGTNCIAIDVGDGFTNDLGVYVIDRRTQTSAPVITTPPGPTVVWQATDDSDNDPTNGFNQTFVVSLTPAADTTGALTLQMAGTPPTPIATLAVAVTDATATFSDVGLQPGAYGVEAVYVDSFGLSNASASLSIDIQIAAPHIVVTSPRSGSEHNNANFEVVVTDIGGGTTPTACILYVDGVSATNAVWADSSVPLMLDATLAEGSHDLRVECTDGAATPATTFQAINGVIIDDTAPGAPTFVDEPAGTPGQLEYSLAATQTVWVNGAVPLSGGGTKHAVVSQIDSSVESLNGFRLELTSDAPGVAGTETGTQALCLWEGSAGPPDATCVSTVIVANTVQDLTFPSVSFGSGPVGPLTLTLEIVDRAGNRSTPPAQVVLQKDTEGPVVTQLTPDPSTILLTRADDVNLGTPGVDVQFTFNVTGADETAVCTSASPLCLSLQVVPPSSLGPATLYQTVTGGAAAFPTMGFLDSTVNRYVATVEITDNAGNLTSQTYSFDVEAVQPSLTWQIPTTDGALNIGSNLLAAQATGYPTDSPIVLCTTSLPASVTPLVAGSCNPKADLGCPCEDVAGGRVVAAGVLLGDLLNSNIVLSGTVLGQGVQQMHWEARAVVGTPDLASNVLSLDVDTMAPVVTGITFADNVAGNDGPNIRLGASEGTVGAGVLQTSVSVAVTGVAAGQAIVVRANGVQVDDGTPVVGAGPFFIDLQEGNNQSITAVVTDQAGNQSDGTPIVRVDIDFTPPVVTLPQPGGGVIPAIFTSSDGTPVDAGADGNRANDYLEVTVDLPVSDNNLAGAVLTLSSYDADTGGALLTTPVSSAPLVGTETSHAFNAVQLVAGHNYMEATLTDVFGNSGDTLSGGLRTSYPADFYGPVLTLEMFDGASGPVVCTAGTPCVADTLAPAGGMVQLDRAMASTYCPPIGTCNNAGSDLRFTLDECANSDPSLEDCTTTPINVYVQSTVDEPSPNPFAALPTNVFTANANILGTPASVFDQPGGAGYGFQLAVTRQVRLRAVDKNGNEGLSGVLFVTLNQDAIVPGASLVDGSLAAYVPPVTLADTTAPFGVLYLGDRYNVSGTTGTFAMNLRVAVTETATQTPIAVDLTCSPNTCDGTNFTITNTTILGSAPNFYVEFLAVQVPTSAPGNPAPATFSFVVDCGGAASCGQRDYTGIHADIDPPTYQFDRCSLCALDVPYGGGPACSTLLDQTSCTGVGCLWTSGLCAPDCTGCAADNADTNADVTTTAAAPANWSYALDRVKASPTTFSTSPGVPLDLLVKGLDDGENITIDSSQAASISGNVAANVTGCGSTTSACTVPFGALNLDSLPNNADRHIVTVSFTDRAGNPAVPDVLRCAGMSCDVMDEAITARVDTLRPEGVLTTACIGESTTPAGPGTSEDSLCATYCAATGGTCSRRQGQATLRWLAPHDDGLTDTSTDSAVSYEILVAARGIPYNTSGVAPYPASHVDCSTVVVGADLERVAQVAAAPLSGTATGLFGEELVTSLTELYPHRAYCFAMVGIDDAGNRATVGGTQVQRVMPLLNDIPGLSGGPQNVAFDPLVPNDADPIAAFADGGGTVALGYRAAGIGDLDNDGRGDFIIGVQQIEAPFESSMDVYLSYSPNLAAQCGAIGNATDCARQGCSWSTSCVPSDLGTPIHIAGPDFTSFSVNVAHGDFDGDGVTDLAVCSPFSGPTFSEGALYLYYGRHGATTADPGIGIDASPARLNSAWPDTDRPQILPDVTLLGASGGGFCYKVLLADIDGRPGDDLIVIPRLGFTNAAFVFGFVGGDRNRFPFNDPIGSPTTALYTGVSAKTATPGSAWDPGNPGVAPACPGCPDFRLRSASGYNVAFPSNIAVGDFNGDGIGDIAVSDQSAPHGTVGVNNGAGEVYVYRGSTSLLTEVSAPDTLPAQLLQIIRYVGTRLNFGWGLGAIPAPRPGDAADWLYASADTRTPLIFKATDDAAGGGANAGLVPRASTSGWADPRVYPVGGATPYWVLSSTGWDGVGVAAAGNDIAVLGEFDGLPGVDIALAPVLWDSNHIFIYSYDAADEASGGIGFSKRAVLRSAPSNCASNGNQAPCTFGWTVGLADNYAGAGPQLIVSSYSELVTAYSYGMVHLYR